MAFSCSRAASSTSSAGASDIGAASADWIHSHNASCANRSSFAVSDAGSECSASGGSGGNTVFNVVAALVSDWIGPLAAVGDELISGFGSPASAFVGVQLRGQLRFPRLHEWVDD